MMFRGTLTALGIFVSALAAGAEPPAAPAADRQIAQQLGAQLKAALASALAESPQSAIAVCNERAPAIAGQLAGEHGVAVGRTALRVRNPANRPSDWQQEVLERFLARQRAGEPLATMEYSATVVDGGIKEHRYMKAIPTEPLCLTCHGTAVAPPLQEAIRLKYPDDRATGFQAGDLRGAVYVIRRE